MSGNFVSIIPLGGVGEIGKNMWVYEYLDDIILVDAGVMFPDEEMLGVDLVIPDISYLVENRHRVKAIVLSHGHEDHIGALPYVLKQIQVPVYGTRLTLGLLEGKLEEHGLVRQTELKLVKSGQKVQIGAFNLEFIHVNHSLPDVVAVAIKTPMGSIIHCTDFKIDHTPIDGKVMDLGRFAELGKEGVLCLLSDSTNAEHPGYTLSEKTVGSTFMQTFNEAEGRIIVATFASNIHRIQQVIDAAKLFHRKVCFVGRSMVNNVAITSEMGYLNIPKGITIPMEDVDKYKAEKIVIVSTGSQGEPMAALTRMARSEHRNILIGPGDTVIISAHPIPGNERLIGKIIDQLFKLGAEVIYQRFSGVHVSGHASQEELKFLINLTNPRYFIPVHGEYRMLWRHAKLAEEIGIPSDRIVIPEIGDRIEIKQSSIKIAGRVESGAVMIDGLGIGDVGNVVLKDRSQLAQDGILVAVVTVDEKGEIITEPELVSRGFVYMKESEDLMKEAGILIGKVISYQKGLGQNSLRLEIKEALSKFFYEKTKRHPIILPVVMEIPCPKE
jgi:ribonuclease J